MVELKQKRKQGDQKQKWILESHIIHVTVHM